MKVSFSSERNVAECLIVPCFEKSRLAVKVKDIPLASLEIGDFLGKAGECRFDYHTGVEKRVLFIGLGKEEDLSCDVIRSSYADAVRACHNKKIKHVNALFPSKTNLLKKDVILAASEGLFLTNYAYNKLKHDLLKENPVVLLQEATFIGLNKEEEKAVRDAHIVADAVHFVRDMVNGNADIETPSKIAEIAKELEKLSPNIRVTVLGKKEIISEKMGLLLAVNKGSDKDPAFVIAEYNGNPKSNERVAIVGKGITYDTGGLDLKPATGMVTMKCDMAGAAAALGFLYAAAILKLKLNFTVLTPLTENAIGPSSYKPGDVYFSKSGKSVEIISTDAEGRLILADALTYAVTKVKPKMIIDIATLTGAVVVALGEDICGFLTNSDAIGEKMFKAGEKSGEHVWRLPLFEDYKESLKSDIADIKNCAEGRQASTITSALFLKEFVGKIPWIHLDVGGAAFLTKPKKWTTTKATGFGVRLLLEFFNS